MDDSISKEKKNIRFKDTLNLPKTDFPIRANAKENDPKILEQWEKEDLYTKTFFAHEGNEKFILHDGPPYANGNIHLGTAYNKILKDFIAKSQRMQGKQVPLVPGWDCHGLPIELSVSKAHPEATREELIKECRKFARKWVDIQKNEFKNLGVLADWEHPYLTMNFSYESKILKALADFVSKGYIERKNKTVPWCFSCQTVLASAEIEYYDRKDPSIYVKFALPDYVKKNLFPELANKDINLLVWTTTPWTLPLNRAVILKPKTLYDVLDINGEYIVVAQELSDSICKKAGIEKNVVKTFLSEDLEGKQAKHPFIDNLHVPIILDHFVSLEDGTACVHCAPGCGPIDYDIAIKNNLDIYSPLNPDGTYSQEIVPEELKGVSILDGQGWVIKTLAEQDKLFHKESIKHSFPHCWRCRTGLMFRATKQWFCDLEKDNLRERAIKSLDSIAFLPERSKNFLKATIESRLEWCLSRQRVWGVPIPAFICTKCDYAYFTPELIKKVAQGVEREGVEYWYSVTPKELGLENFSCPQCYGLEFKKEYDILDVWFDSGVSHYAVLYKNDQLAYPANLYLEGVDQHRGWFQSSLLTSLVLEEEACMKAILTHGFTVDEKGIKMSKSLGNVVSPQELIDKLGTDGLRLWASSINYEGDAIVSQTLLSNVSQVYRKIRNTARFLLSNLFDFDIEKDAITLTELQPIDQYALEELFLFNARVKEAYNNADFTAVFHEFADYCTNELSSFYLDIIKDRLYVEKANGKKRRSAQTVCWYILDTLTKLMAPILSFTAEQISDFYQKNKTKSIHLQEFNDLADVWSLLAKFHEEKQIKPAWESIPQVELLGTSKPIRKINELVFVTKRRKLWELLIGIRDALLKAIEVEREKGLIKHPLEARLILSFEFDDSDIKLINNFFDQLRKAGQTPEEFFKEFLIVSQVDLSGTNENTIETELKGLRAKVEKALGQKCPRCWHYDVTQNEYDLCQRCQDIV